MYHKRKVERKTFAVPPEWCWPICDNAYHDICMEGCALKRDASRFSPKEEFALTDLPPFPLKEWQEDLTQQERQAVAGVYLAKMVDHIQGRVPDVWTRNTRPDPDGSRDCRISPNVQVESLRNDPEEGDSPSEDRPEREDQAGGSVEVVGGAGTAD
jgi:hypothetical protein